MTIPTDKKPLHVCLVGTGSPCCLGGLAAITRHLGLALQNQGHKVSAVARFRTDPPPGVQLAAKEPPGRFDGVSFPTHIVAPSGLAAMTLSRLPTLLSRPQFQTQGIRLFEAAYDPGVNAVIADDVDAVHFVGAGWEMLGFPTLRRALQIGASFTIMPAVHPERWGDSDLDIRLYNKADTVFTLTDFEKQHLIGKGVTAPIKVQGLGPAVGDGGEGARFRREHDLGERPLVLFVARRVPYKGYNALAEAMEKVRQAVPNACLVVLSGPGETPPVQSSQLLELIGASDAVKADAYAACDVVCVPSTDESFGIVYVEGWRYKKPVVGGPAPAVRELIEQNVTGRTVEQDPDAIAATLIDLLQDPVLRDRMGMAGFHLQQSQFTWETAAINLVETARDAVRKS